MTYILGFIALCILLRMLPIRSRIKLASLHNAICSWLLALFVWMAFHAGRLLLGTKPIIMYAMSVNSNVSRRI